MKFLRKIDNKKLNQKNSHWTSDLLNNEGIKIFHLSQEAIQAYRTNIEIIKRREIALQVEQTLELFINYVYSREEKDFLCELLHRNNNRISKIRSLNQSSFNLLQKLDSVGIELLNIPKNINIPLLKKLYRRASMKFHPDIGGSHDKMLKINESYTLFHTALINFVPSQTNVDKIHRISSLPETWNDLIFSIYLVLACINGDFLATDRAFPYLKKSYKLALQSSSRFIGEFAQDLSGMGGVLNSTCKALRSFIMKEEWLEAAAITSYLGDRIIQCSILADIVELRPEREYYPSKTDITGWFGTNLVLNHAEKARNAFRLGKINEKRYKTAMKRFNIKKDNEQAICNKIDRC